MREASEHLSINGSNEREQNVMVPRLAFMHITYGPFISPGIAYYVLAQWHDNAGHIRIANRNLRRRGHHP